MCTSYFRLQTVYAVLVSLAFPYLSTNPKQTVDCKSPVSSQFHSYSNVASVDFTVLKLELKLS